VRILISNDDGIYSPGLAALARVASKFGEVRIVAPDVEQSSMSQAITSSRPVSYKKAKVDAFDAYRVNGTPSDCVAVGVFNWDQVDLVLSGINLGTNLGSAMWYSGTLAAAKQAALFDLRGIAFSMPVEEDATKGLRLQAVEKWAAKVLALLIDQPELKLVNVNIPAKPKGIRWTRQSVRLYDGKIVASKDPMGRSNFWYTVVPVTETEEDTDRWAFSHGYVSLTPMRLDLTDDALLLKAKHKVAKIRPRAARK